MKTALFLFFSLFALVSFSQELASIDFMRMPTGNTLHSITTKSPDLPNKTLVVLVEADGNIFYHYSIKFQNNEPVSFYIMERKTHSSRSVDGMKATKHKLYQK